MQTLQRLRDSVTEISTFVVIIITSYRPRGGKTICPLPMAVRLAADMSIRGRSAVCTSLVAGHLQAASVPIALAGTDWRTDHGRGIIICTKSVMCTESILSITNITACCPLWVIDCWACSEKCPFLWCIWAAIVPWAYWQLLLSVWFIELCSACCCFVSEYCNGNQ